MADFRAGLEPGSRAMARIETHMTGSYTNHHTTEDQWVLKRPPKMWSRIVDEEAGAERYVGPSLVEVGSVRSLASSL